MKDDLNNLVLNDKDKADCLADVFEKVYSNEQNARSMAPTPAYPIMSYSVCYFYADEIYNLLKRWPPSNSLTPDKIPLSIIKEIASCIAKTLKYIFNQSFLRSEIPLKWKESFVTPI